MYVKKIWISIVFILAFVPVAAYAQTSLYTSGKLAGGLEIRFPKESAPDNEAFPIVNVGIGFNNGQSKISLIGGLTTYQYTHIFDKPAWYNDPSVVASSRTESITVYEIVYIGGIEGIHLYPLGTTGFEIYSRGEFTAFFSAEGPGVFPTV